MTGTGWGCGLEGFEDFETAGHKVGNGFTGGRLREAVLRSRPPRESEAILIGWHSSEVSSFCLIFVRNLANFLGGDGAVAII